MSKRDKNENKTRNTAHRVSGRYISADEVEIDANGNVRIGDSGNFTVDGKNNINISGDGNVHISGGGEIWINGQRIK